MSRGPAAQSLVVIDCMGGMNVNPEVEKKLADIQQRSPQHFAEVLSHGRIHFPPRQQSILYRPEQPFSQKQIYLRIVVKMHMMYSLSGGLTVGDQRAMNSFDSVVRRHPTSKDDTGP